MPNAASGNYIEGNPASFVDRPFGCPPDKPKRAIKAMSESAIQRAVFQHIRSRGAPGVFAFHVPNGGYRRRTEAKILKGMGVVAGVPDVIAIHQGGVYALELKAEGGRPTESQFKAVEAIRTAGGFACVVYGLDAALRCLEVWGVLVGRSA